MATKFYAVKIGKKPGIYTTWEECRAMVEGYSGAKYKSFPTREEAQAYLGGPGSDVKEKQTDYAFVDGSYNTATQVYGYGGFLVHGETKEILQGSGSEPDMASMRNVAGEVLGSMAAIEKAIELGLPELTIYYDYMGIEMWATGEWKRNKKGTIAYYEYVNSVRDQITLHFVKVKGHSGVAGNEEADRLAKEAVGITE
ncbi:MAG: ribonuclease H family protein [Lachnospiraceae bacterium]|nr:ribonuclease H family protein [Lachnospiraceae bacterium]